MPRARFGSHSITMRSPDPAVERFSGERVRRLVIERLISRWGLADPDVAELHILAGFDGEIPGRLRGPVIAPGIKAGKVSRP